MEKEIVWKNEKEIAKVKQSYSAFAKAFNEAVDRLEETFKVTLKEDDVKLFFENRKCVTPFIDALADYIWGRGKLRVGISQEQLALQIKKELAAYVRATCSLYYASPEYIEIKDCRLHVLENKLEAYLLEQHSISLNSENRKKVWDLANKACSILNELEFAAVESSVNWFVTHATNVGGGSALIYFDKGKYYVAGAEMSNIK